MAAYFIILCSLETYAQYFRVKTFLHDLQNLTTLLEYLDRLQNLH